MDCGAACLAMVASYYGKECSLLYIRELSNITKEGVSIAGLTNAAEKIGFETLSGKLDIKTLIEEKDSITPCILHWNKNHFVVLKQIYKTRFSKKNKFVIYDPSYGKSTITEEKFIESWIACTDKKGVGVFLSKADNFNDVEVPSENKINIKKLFSYIKPYYKQFGLMLFLLLLGSLVNLALPFLTQILIDKGISDKDISLITLILASQLALFGGVLIIEVFRNWLVLFIGTRLSIDIISDFFKKLLNLPIKYFDTKLMGDFSQRIHDNRRIEDFLSSQSLTTFFSLVVFSVFLGVLFYYDYRILLVYLLLTSIAILWSLYWLKKRKAIDYLNFKYRSENQESIYEMLNGITEMKLNQYEEYKRKEWEDIQRSLFKVNTRSLRIGQLQMSGYDFFNQLKNILVTFIASLLVVRGAMSLGELLAISYIIGQMNSPISQLVSFFRSLQDAKLSIERLGEVEYYKPEEESTLPLKPPNTKGDILIKGLSFQYAGANSPKVLKNINIDIVHGKVTAIVGASGSGKTTLIKLLLRFYESSSGNIFYGNDRIKEISPMKIRANSGVVMQEGYIFADSILQNIIMGDDEINEKRLIRAIDIANIGDFINTLPLGLSTKVGATGNDISGGQKQRLLIARAVYKNPSLLFFDEATSALDAENEKIIHDRLQKFFTGKTVVIIAHRLSTVKKADNIVVLKKGEVVEQGTHQQLVEKKGEYFNLVKNQLELGN